MKDERGKIDVERDRLDAQVRSRLQLGKFGHKWNDSDALLVVGIIVPLALVVLCTIYIAHLGQR